MSGYAGQDDAAARLHELDVDCVVDGTVRVGSGRLRVSRRL
jgi:TolB-like protein